MFGAVNIDWISRPKSSHGFEGVWPGVGLIFDKVDTVLSVAKTLKIWQRFTVLY